MSFEISSDTRSERFRDQVSKALAEALGGRLPYGRWTVTLRSDRSRLSVALAGPEVREEWVFALSDRSDAIEIANQLRRLVPPARGGEAGDPAPTTRAKPRGQSDRDTAEPRG